MTTAATDRPDLTARLEAAQLEEQPLRAEVERLQQQLHKAIEGHDFIAAHEAQTALPEARERHAIAAATTAGLAAAVNRIKDAAAADERAVAEAQQREQARQEHEQWAAKITEYDAAAREELAACQAGIEAVRASYQAAHAHAQAADEAKQQSHRCLTIMGHAGPPPMPNNYARAVMERDQLLAAIVRGRI